MAAIYHVDPIRTIYLVIVPLAWENTKFSQDNFSSKKKNVYTKT